LDHLGQQLRKTVSHLSRERNSGFTPHLTIGRQASQRLRPTLITPITWQVKEFVLIRSILHEYPARYETLGRFPLRGAPLPPMPKQANLGF
jgi:2'-5' RNA ligase